MPINDFDSWRKEIIDAGWLGERETARYYGIDNADICNRYVELAEMAAGSTDARAYETLLESMHLEEDFEVYETPTRILFECNPDIVVGCLVSAFPTLIEQTPGRAGDYLSLMVSNHRLGLSGLLSGFKATIWGLGEPRRTQILEFIAKEEREGWLRDKSGYFSDRA